MRKLLALAAAVLLICLLTLSVSAETGATSVSFYATVGNDSSCQVTVTALLHLEQAVEELSFPVPTEAENIMLNGSRARITRTGTAKLVDLSGIAGSIAGDFSVTVTYSLKDVVQVNENDFPQLQLPMLSGFAYPVSRLDFSVTLPDTVPASPAFSSGYHKTDIEKSLYYTKSGGLITGNSTKELKDHETLVMTLLVPEEMFPQTGIALPDFDLTNTLILLSGALALLYWLLTLRCKPPRRTVVSTPPDGFSAGQMGSVLTLRGADLTMMVFTWAQLGYVLLRQDRQGRIHIHKRMEMGNERSGFEQRCFKNLFGKRGSLVDTTGYHYATRCQAAEKLQPNIRSLILPNSGNFKVFRALAAAMGLFAGAQLGIALHPGSPLQWLLMILFALLGLVCSYVIHSWADSLFLMDKRALWAVPVICVLWLVIGMIGTIGGTTLGVILFQLLAGLMSSFGGRRTEAGRQVMSDVLGLRRYLRRLSKEELQRIVHNNPEYYFHMLPYAMALGVDKAFAKRFGKQPIPRCPYLQLDMDAQLTAAQWNGILRDVAASMNVRRQRLRGEKLLGILQSFMK